MSDKKRTIPDAKNEPQPMPHALECKGYKIVEWCPTPDGTGKPEAVAMIIDLGMEDVKIALRFNNPESVDQLIAVLGRHRFGVWPEKDPH